METGALIDKLLSLHVEFWLPDRQYKDISYDFLEQIPRIVEKLRKLEKLECTSSTESTKKSFPKPRPGRKAPLTKLPQNLRKRRAEIVKQFHEEMAQYRAPESNRHSWYNVTTVEYRRK